MHTQHVYFGDMKAANLLVFRDSRVKLGDLGISTKINPEDTEGTTEQYEIKGFTAGYIN